MYNAFVKSSDLVNAQEPLHMTSTIKLRIGAQHSDIGLYHSQINKLQTIPDSKWILIINAKFFYFKLIFPMITWTW